MKININVSGGAYTEIIFQDHDKNTWIITGVRKADLKTEFIGYADKHEFKRFSKI